MANIFFLLLIVSTFVSVFPLGVPVDRIAAGNDDAAAAAAVDPVQLPDEHVVGGDPLPERRFSLGNRL